MDEQNGLHVKYHVTKLEDNSVVEGCFVLRPDKDSHARVALRAYATSVQDVNPVLADDIRAWLASIAPADAEEK